MYFCVIGGDIPFFIFYCIYLILLPFFLINLGSSLSIMWIFLKTSSGFNKFLKGFLSLYLLLFHCDFSYFLSLPAFEFVCSCLSSYFNCDVQVLTLNISCFLMWVFSTTNFPLNTALAVSKRFWYIVSSFSLVSKKLISALILSFTQVVQFPCSCAFFSEFLNPEF